MSVEAENWAHDLAMALHEAASVLEEHGHDEAARRAKDTIRDWLDATCSPKPGEGPGAL